MSSDDRQVSCHPLFDDGGTVVGEFTSAQVISGESLGWKGRLIARSGAVEDADPRRASMLRWGNEGVRRLDAGLERWLGAAGPEERLCVWPCASDVVSDLPSCLSMLRRWEGRGVEAICDPGAMMTPEMFRVADDFVLRVLETLGPLSTVPIVVISKGLTERQVEITKRFAGELGKAVVSEKGQTRASVIP